jgi:caffeoyl-CoA O-methyltransferase
MKNVGPENRRASIRVPALISLGFLMATNGASIESWADEALDERVRAYLDARRSEWRDLNVPYEDGRILHDIVVEHGFTRGFEIGTSTGHSTLWIAWAMSKTGGKVTTFEIDAAGVYDFVFSDADKDWYVRYFDDMYPKLAPLACFVAHNVDESFFRSRGSWQARYLEHVRSIPDMDTYLHPDARNGVAVTCRAGN